MHTTLRSTVLSAALAALFLAAPAGAARWIPTDLVLDAGASFATTGDPNGGGASLRAVPLWRVTDRVSFGVEIFADDIGTEARDMIDANDGSSRGVVAQTHRWVYGGAWHADGDLYRGKRWKAGVSGSWGYWRVEDDVRGDLQAAFSGVGFGGSAHLRRSVSRSQDLGVAAGYARVFSDRSAEFDRVDRYAWGALEWRWSLVKPN
ncbi:MAG: hypothetical protein HZA61_12555 [Candidatus Eisenbacteria bacterium]|uniref:DUF481 domain-containing protein n=1 Tax=Eiseniibacteriota bacterium TaxID=2212470 RepID=A0A933SD21_UNCEI|nr:hypothetical protein [Candidatus Eisenbacteria bacterium]